MTKQILISELIQRLQEAQIKYGNLPVFIDYDSQYQSASKYQIVLKEDENGKFILFE